MDPTLHSFGGRALDRFLYELDPDDGGAGAAAGAGEGAAADAGGDGGAAAAADAAAAGAESGGDAEGAGDGGQAAAPAPADLGFDPRELQAELEYLREQNAQLAQRLNPAAAGGDWQEPTLTLDPFDDRFGESLQQLIRSELQQAVQPLAGRFEQQELAAVQQEGEQRIVDAITDEVARNGEFVPAVGDTPEQRQPYEEADRQARQLVRTVAEQLFPQFAERYGVGPRAGEFAIEKASQQVRALLKASADAAVAREKNRVATLAGARSEGGSGAAGSIPAVQGMSERPLTPQELARKYGRTA